MYENTDNQTVATAPKRRPGLFGMLRWLVRVLWTGANGVRKFVHMLLMFFILAIAIGSLSDAPQ